MHISINHTSVGIDCQLPQIVYGGCVKLERSEDMESMRLEINIEGGRKLEMMKANSANSILRVQYPFFLIYFSRHSPFPLSLRRGTVGTKTRARVNL